jgi:hypothetical protein
MYSSQWNSTQLVVAEEVAGAVVADIVTAENQVVMDMVVMMSMPQNAEVLAECHQASELARADTKVSRVHLVVFKEASQVREEMLVAVEYLRPVGLLSSLISCGVIADIYAALKREADVFDEDIEVPRYKTQRGTFGGVKGREAQGLSGLGQGCLTCGTHDLMNRHDWKDCTNRCRWCKEFHVHELCMLKGAVWFENNGMGPTLAKVWADCAKVEAWTRLLNDESMAEWAQKHPQMEPGIQTYGQ